MTSMHRKRYFEREAYNKKMIMMANQEEQEGEAQEGGEENPEQPQE